MNNGEDERTRVLAERYLASCDEYTDPYEREKLINDWVKKRADAVAAVGDMRSRAGEVSGKRVLDIGFGNGLYSMAFAKTGAQVSSLEVNPVLLSIAQETLLAEGVEADMRIYDGTVFPFADNYFDYAFSVSVLEHVSDPALLLREASRVLKPGGKFYLAFPNRWRALETHTGVWFLSYLPRDMAQWLMRTLAKRNSIEELNLHFISYWSLKHLLRGTSLHIVLEYGGKTWPRRALKKFLAFFGIHYSAILGTVMVILEKRI